MNPPAPQVTSRRITLETTPGGLQRLRVINELATAELYLQGAHLTSFRPHGQDDLLWVSQAEAFQSGQAIRGGIPVCWPWFGPHPDSALYPSHGLVRTALWNWEAIRDDARVSQLRLWLETDGTDPGFAHRARVELVVTVAASLTLRLITTNLGHSPFTLSQALHSYLPITSPDSVRLTGLSGYPYLDKLTGTRQPWPQSFAVNQEIDRIVLDEGQPVILDEPGKVRRIIRREGSRSLVVWNPWIDKSRTLSNFNDDDYRSMLCLEAANAADDCRQLLPGEHHQLTTELGLITTDA